MVRVPSPVLEITEDIIASAERRNSAHCMIADTVKVAVPDASYVSVDLQSISFTLLKMGMRFTYLTPALAQAALVNFDQGDHTEPFEVRLKKGHATKSGHGKPKGKTEISATGVRSGGKPPPRGALQAGSPQEAQRKKKKQQKDGITGVGTRRTFGIKNLKL